MSPITNLINDPYFIHVFQWEIAVVCDGNIEFWIKMKLGFFLFSTDHSCKVSVQICKLFLENIFFNIFK
jgi:hypothetical protein